MLCRDDVEKGRAIVRGDRGGEGIADEQVGRGGWYGGCWGEGWGLMTWAGAPVLKGLIYLKSRSIN